MDKKIAVNSSPHLKDVVTTRSIMFDVIIALIPAVIMGVYLFSYMAAIIIAVTVVSCVLFEMLYNILTKQKQTIGNLSAVVTGLLLSLSLPPAASSIWLGVVGALVAIVIVKMIFGGIGNNVFNPAIAARVFLTVAFSGQMTSWLAPGVDTVSTATPLAMAATGIVTSNLDLFLGNISGCILTGGLLIGAIFMATDYSTSPMTTKGKIIFGIGLGIVTMGIRVYGNLPEGVSFAILFMNVLVPLIDRYTLPKSFGGLKKKNA
jgi:electron transport complex protein RnfD